MLDLKKVMQREMRGTTLANAGLTALGGLSNELDNEFDILNGQTMQALAHVSSSPFLARGDANGTKTIRQSGEHSGLKGGEHPGLKGDSMATLGRQWDPQQDVPSVHGGYLDASRCATAIELTSREGVGGGEVPATLGDLPPKTGRKQLLRSGSLFEHEHPIVGSPGTGAVGPSGLVGPSGAMSPGAPTHVRAICMTEVNFRYMKHVLLKFILCKEHEVSDSPSFR